MKKIMIKMVLRLVAALCLVFLVGCGPQLKTEFVKMGETENNKYYGMMAATTNERGPNSVYVGITAEQKQQSITRTVITNIPGSQPQQAAPAKWEPPKQSPRGKKALICPPSPPPPAPAKPTQTVIETVKSPETMVIGGASGSGPSTLQSWGNAFLGNAPLAAGIATMGFGFKPNQTTQQVNTGPTTATGTGTGGAGGAGGAGGDSSAASSSSSSAAAAAAAAAGK